jgi:carboxylate-amine ligase
MRITDVPTRLGDSIGIAGMYQCILGFLYRLRRDNQRWRTYPHMLIKENRWRAQRYGYDQGLVDFGKGEVVPFARLLDELIELVAPEAARFDCAAELAALRDILRRGTSAHRQLQVHTAALAAGASKAEALKQVVDWLVQETVADL